MYTKIEISGIIEVCTGMHIGGAAQFAAIGAVDSPVVEDVFERKPMIPGSSLKGKLRSLLAQKYNPKENTGIVKTHDEDCTRILRLFGASASKDNNSQTPKNKYKSRLIFSDMFMENAEELNERDIDIREVKFENTIDRLTGKANPRQIERVVRGSVFGLRIIYNVIEKSEIEEDFITLLDGFKLLEYDYLGGHSSRGYGRVRIRDLEFDTVTGELDETIELKMKDIIKEYNIKRGINEI